MLEMIWRKGTPVDYWYGCKFLSFLQIMSYDVHCPVILISWRHIHCTKNFFHCTIYCRGSLTQHFSLPWMKIKTTKTWSAWGGKVADLSKEKGPEPFSPLAFIRFIGIGIRIKLINHCQPVRVKQYRIYTEPWGLILSYSQSARGP